MLKSFIKAIKAGGKKSARTVTSVTMPVNLDRLPA